MSEAFYAVEVTEELIGAVDEVNDHFAVDVRSRGCALKGRCTVRLCVKPQREALQVGLERKAKEFVEKGGEVYAKA